MDAFEIGDVVILASGGPAMTVAEVLPWGELFCVWFTEDRRCVGDSFDARLLRVASEWTMDETPTAPLVAPAEVNAPTPPTVAEAPAVAFVQP